MGTLWDPFGWFLEVLGAILGDEKIVAKIGWQKVTQRTPGAPGSSRKLPCFPYQVYLIPKTCPVTRNTPLVPYRRHGVGFIFAHIF